MNKGTFTTMTQQLTDVKLTQKDIDYIYSNIKSSKYLLLNSNDPDDLVALVTDFVEQAKTYGATEISTKAYNDHVYFEFFYDQEPSDELIEARIRHKLAERTELDIRAELYPTQLTLDFPG